MMMMIIITIIIIIVITTTNTGSYDIFCISPFVVELMIIKSVN